jgi:two-component system chemotaxis response regulator CheY
MKKTKSILIVDDEDSVLAAMKDLLESKGYTVLEANNGVTGLKLLTEKAVDGVVLDLNMPRMDGYMFMEHLRNRWAVDGMGRPFPKVLVLTAVDKNADLGLSKNLGASNFMNKPFKSSEFVEAVKKLVQS